MSVLLCIDSSTTYASVALVKDEAVLCFKANTNQKDHASFLQPAIQSMMNETNIQLKDLNAIAVTVGPGSYTGLRVGLSSAKGLCYALQLPLITLSTTLVMSYAALKQLKDTQTASDDFFLCPMIDARRMEVFTATYNSKLECIDKNRALILDNFSFNELLSQKQTYFFGDGAPKWRKYCINLYAQFIDVEWNASDMMLPSLSNYDQKRFASLAYSLPDYGKAYKTHNN